jgi:GAF domain-containing protein
VQLFDREHETLENRLTLDHQGQEQKGSKDFLMSQGLAEKVMRDKKAVLISDLASDAEFMSRKSLVRAGITSAVAAPIFDGNDILGILYADIREGAQELTEIDVATVTMLASIAGTTYVAATLFAAMLRSEAELRQENEQLRERLAAVESTQSDVET